VNSLANDFLSANAYDKVIVEILYINDYQPSKASLDNLKKFLEARLNKPSGIMFLQNAILSTRRPTMTSQELKLIEEHTRTQFTNGKTIAAYIFFADADFAEDTEDSKTLGLAYGTSSVAIFEKTILRYSNGLGQPPAANLETTVLEHEFGHLLGLSNNGTKMQSKHQDAPHGSHCTNSKCLMYYAADTNHVLANLLGGSVPELDAACVADLKANGGK
jgi:hypothetical protein